MDNCYFFNSATIAHYIGHFRMRLVSIITRRSPLPNRPSARGSFTNCNWFDNCSHVLANAPIFAEIIACPVQLSVTFCSVYSSSSSA